MASMLAMAFARSAPMAIALGSWGAAPAAAVAPAGVGVAGGAAEVALECEGAAGAAGVAAGARAGVSGTALEEAAGAAATLGWLGGQSTYVKNSTIAEVAINAGLEICEMHTAGDSYLVHHAYNEALLLDLVRLDGVLIFQDLALEDVSFFSRMMP